MYEDREIVEAFRTEIETHGIRMPVKKAVSVIKLLYDKASKR